MPTYQYACTECGHAFEKFQSFFYRLNIMTHVCVAARTD